MQGEAIYKGGLYMKIVRIEYQRADYAGGDYLRGGLYMKAVRMEYQGVHHAGGLRLSMRGAYT